MEERVRISISMIFWYTMKHSKYYRKLCGITIKKKSNNHIPFL